MGRLGSVWDDLQAIAGAYQSYQNTGSVADWLSSQMAAFRAVPGSLPGLQQQIANVKPIVASSASATAALDTAAATISSVQSRYPAVSARVNALMGTLLPILPQLRSGTFDAQVASVLGAQGVDIASTIHDATAIIGDRDAAATAIQDAVTNPDLSVSVRDKAIAALHAAGSAEWWKVAAAAVIGFVIIRSVMK